MRMLTPLMRSSIWETFTAGSLRRPSSMTKSGRIDRRARAGVSGTERAPKRRASEANLSEAPKGTAAKRRRRAPKNEKLDLGNFHGGIIASAFLYDEIGKG